MATRSHPGSASDKELPFQCRRHKRCRFHPWARKIPWRRKWQPTPVFLPGESHGQRSLVGYSPWGHKQLDMTEQQMHSLFFHGVTPTIFSRVIHICCLAISAIACHLPGDSGVPAYTLLRYNKEIKEFFENTFSSCLSFPTGK